MGWHEPKDIRGFIQQALRVRRTLITKGVSQKPDQQMLDDMRRLEMELLQRGHRPMAVACQVFYKNARLIYELLPGEGSKGAFKHRKRFEAIMAQAEAVARFYGRDIERIRYPFYLYDGYGYAAKLCGPTTVAVVQVREQVGGIDANTNIYRYGQAELAQWTQYCEPCGPEVFRKLLLKAQHMCLGMIDASHRALPMKDTSAVDALLQAAAGAAGHGQA